MGPRPPAPYCTRFLKKQLVFLNCIFYRRVCAHERQWFGNRSGLCPVWSDTRLQLQVPTKRSLDLSWLRCWLFYVGMLVQYVVRSPRGRIWHLYSSLRRFESSKGVCLSPSYTSDRYFSQTEPLPDNIEPLPTTSTHEAWPPAPVHCQAFAGGGEVTVRCCRGIKCEHCQSFPQIQVGFAEDQQSQSSGCTLQEQEEGGPPWPT